MSLQITCPPGTAITSIPVPGCLQDFGQITRLILQRTYSTGTTLNSFTIGSANPNLSASWDTFFDAADGTKATITPQIENSDVASPEAVKYGGGDATAFGIQKNIAKTPSTFTGELHAVRADVAEAIEDYEGEIASVYFVNEHGYIAGLADSVSSATTFRGFPIALQTFFISELNTGKRETPDMYKLTFQLYPGWSRKFYVVVPSDFNGNELS